MHFSFFCSLLTIVELRKCKSSKNELLLQDLKMFSQFFKFVRISSAHFDKEKKIKSILN